MAKLLISIFFGAIVGLLVGSVAWSINQSFGTTFVIKEVVGWTALIVAAVTVFVG